MEAGFFNLMAFYIFAGFSVMAALMVLFTKNAVHAVFLLTLVFLGVAGVYFASNAEFVAVTQILVYIGGILILFMFGLMLTRRIDGGKLVTENTRIFPAIILGIALLATILYPLLDGFPVFTKPALLPVPEYSTTQQIGIKFLTDHLIGLELAAILLLVALVGAAFLAGTTFKKKETNQT